jgi:AcrR family transcriptional regulator
MRQKRARSRHPASIRGDVTASHELTPFALMRDKCSVAARTQPRSRGDDTRARLFAAAVRLFAAHGYADTTVDRVVREAGVAKGTFFIHFATKDAVITELVRNQVRIARRARDRVLAGGGSRVEAIRAAVMTLGEQAAADRQLSRAVITANILSPALGGFAESVFGAMTEEMIDDVRVAQRAKLLDPKIDAEKIAETLIMLYMGAVLYFATAPRSKPLLQLLGSVVDANLAGFHLVPARGSVRRAARSAETVGRASKASAAKAKKRAPAKAPARPKRR